MKCRNLEKVRREVETIKDKLGEPVDSKIKDLVIGLRRWGIETEASCQGHLLKGLPYPWIDVAWKSTKDLAKLAGLRVWVIKPFGTFVRLIPESKGRRWNILKLLMLQSDAVNFGRFLQDIPDHYFKGESS